MLLALTPKHSLKAELLFRNDKSGLLCISIATKYAATEFFNKLF